MKMMNNNVGKRHGHIGNYYPDAGFGFIVCEADESSYYFHNIGVKFPHEEIATGKAVSFDVEDTPFTRAINIELMDSER